MLVPESAKGSRSLLLGACALLSAGFSACGCAGQEDSENTARVQSALCSKATLTASPAGTVSSGALVHLTATSPSCASGEVPEFRFFARQDGATTAYTELQPYSAAAAADFDTTGKPSGKYTLLVYSRAVGSTASRESSASLSALVGSVCPSVTLTATPVSPQQPGTAVSLGANATCTGGAPEYRFLVLAPGATGYVELASWGSSTFPWNTSGLAVGPYTLLVYARAAGNSSTYEAKKTLSFRIGEACTAVAATASPAKSALPGTDVALSATATCTHDSPAEFQFSYRPTGTSTWLPISTWGPATASWHTSGLSTGAYQLLVEVRASDYPGTAQKTATLSYTIGGLCSSVTIAAAPSSPQPVGTVLGLTGAATCSDGTPEYRFLAKDPVSSSYAEVVPWGASATASWDTQGRIPGLYTLMVETRARDSGSAKQASKTRSYLLGDVCNSVTLAASPASPEPAGTPVTLTSTAKCVFGGVPEYRYSYRPSGASTYTIFRDWGAAVASLDGLGLGEGSYTLRVEARGQGHPGAAESSRTLAYTLSAACAPGYVSNGAGSCVDIDECASDNGGCDPLTTCTNSPGSYACGGCPSGYSGTGSTGCVDIDECASNNGGCGSGATCVNTPGGFTCESAPSFGFFVFSDLQASASIAATAADQMNAIDPDAIAGFSVGDLTFGRTAAQWGYHDAFVDLVFDRSATDFRGTKPRYLAAVGNHDVPASGTTWVTLWNQHLPGQDGLGPPDPANGVYYSLSYDNALFVVMDSEHVTHGNNVTSSWDDTQTVELRDALENTTADFKFLFYHRPVYACESTHDLENSAGLPWVDLAETYGADIVFNGHVHVYTRTHPLMGGQRAADGTGIVQVELGALAVSNTYLRGVDVGSPTITGTDADGATRSDTYNCSMDASTGNLAAKLDLDSPATHTFCHVRITGCSGLLECYKVGAGITTPFDSAEFDHCSP